MFKWCHRTCNTLHRVRLDAVLFNRYDWLEDSGSQAHYLLFGTVVFNIDLLVDARLLSDRGFTLHDGEPAKKKDCASSLSFRLVPHAFSTSAGLLHRFHEDYDNEPFFDNLIDEVQGGVRHSALNSFSRAPHAPSPAACGKRGRELAAMSLTQGCTGILILYRPFTLIEDVWAVWGYNSSGLRWYLQTFKLLAGKSC